MGPASAAQGQDVVSVPGTVLMRSCAHPALTQRRRCQPNLSQDLRAVLASAVLPACSRRIPNSWPLHTPSQKPGTPRTARCRALSSPGNAESARRATAMNSMVSTTAVVDGATWQEDRHRAEPQPQVDGAGRACLGASREWSCRAAPDTRPDPRRSDRRTRGSSGCGTLP